MKYAGILLSVAMAAHGSNAVILRPAANMYSGPTPEKDVVSQSVYASNVQILESQQGWYKARSDDQYTGWVESSALMLSEKRYPNTGAVAVVTSLFANLYPEPSEIRRQPFRVAPFETRLELAWNDEKQPERWLNVQLPDYRSAWVQFGDVSLELAKLSVSGMVTLSRRFPGLPYLWAGMYICDDKFVHATAHDRPVVQIIGRKYLSVQGD